MPPAAEPAAAEPPATQPAQPEEEEEANVSDAAEEHENEGAQVPGSVMEANVRDSLTLPTAVRSRGRRQTPMPSAIHRTLSIQSEDEVHDTPGSTPGGQRNRRVACQEDEATEEEGGGAPSFFNGAGPGGSAEGVRSAPDPFNFGQAAEEASQAEQVEEVRSAPAEEAAHEAPQATPGAEEACSSPADSASLAGSAAVAAPSASSAASSTSTAATAADVAPVVKSPSQRSPGGVAQMGMLLLRRSSNLLGGDLKLRGPASDEGEAWTPCGSAAAAPQKEGTSWWGRSDPRPCPPWATQQALGQCGGLHLGRVW